jgi:hypothetical protein
MDPLRILPQLVSTVSDLPDAILQVNAHCDVMDLRGGRGNPRLAGYLRRQADEGTIELHVHDFLPDHRLWSYLTSLDVSVLPYRFGTHSGWLEACRDLGTTVIAPTCGYFDEQGPVVQYVHDETRYEPESLHEALVWAYRNRPSFGVGVGERRAQRRWVARAHEALYGSLVG